MPVPGVPWSSPDADMRYPSIASHGIIGDLRTAALIADDGTIDFLCLPDFDSPTVFASLLDADRGGRFTIEPVVPGGRREQRYLRDTNVVVTRFAGDDAVIEVVDFMPVERRPSATRVVRLVRGIRGKGVVRWRCAPRFDYARAMHDVSLDGGSARFAAAGGTRLCLTTGAPLRREGRDVVGEVEVSAGRRIAFVLELAGDEGDVAALDLRWAGRSLRRTIIFWRRWIARSRYVGEWRAAVRRSALALKLLQSRRTGAIVAAPTFGLPEQIGGVRNWDFRYAWIRDSSFTVYALSRAGLSEEARAFTRWIMQRCEDAPSPGALQSLYGIDGRRELREEVLDHLEGYRGSRPVRVGNAAYDQLQLDIYGELLDALYLSDGHTESTSRALWRRIVEMTEWVCGNWARPDQGIWEVRGGRQEFLYSRVMCWVAVDRALRIARRRRLPAPHVQWREARDAIHADVHEHFWNDALGTFVGTRGGNTVDAACLVMPIVKFISATEPRWQSTLHAVETRLVRDGLVRRYDMEGMDTDAGSSTAPAFTLCSFWYVECLALAGQREKAREMMSRLVRHASALGLFAENLSADGEQLGNFPQGLVHAALIGAAMGLADAEPRRDRD